MYPSVLNRITNLSQMTIDVCNKLPPNHPMQPPMIEPLQTIPVDAEFVNELAVLEPNIPETSSSQTQPSTQTYEPNLEKAFELASDNVTLESPQQQEPNSEMATNTCIELVIHPEYQPYHLNANHSNISFGITLRNIARRRSSFNEQSVFDQHFSRLEEQILIVQPISVAQPLTQTTLNPVESEQMIIEHVVNEVPTQIGTTLASSSPFVLKHVNDPPFVPNHTIVIESNISTIIPSEPSSSNSTQLTDITFPLTHLLDSIILKEVCENIFKDLNKLVKTRSNFVHEEDYVSEWTTLRSRLDYMMCELQKLTLEAHDKALLDLQKWFHGVTMYMDEVEIKRSQERIRLYLSNTPMYLDASSIISSSVQSDNPDFRWLTKLKV